MDTVSQRPQMPRCTLSELLGTEDQDIGHITTFLDNVQILLEAANYLERLDQDRKSKRGERVRGVRGIWGGELQSKGLRGDKGWGSLCVAWAIVSLVPAWHEQEMALCPVHAGRPVLAGTSDAGAWRTFHVSPCSSVFFYVQTKSRHFIPLLPARNCQPHPGHWH